MAFVTLKDVAQRAGVSAAAVSQILHNKGRFSSDTRQLVLKTVEEMGYVPDQRARSMRSSDTKTVGLLVPDLRNPYFADLVSSMEDELYAQGYSTLIGTSIFASPPVDTASASFSRSCNLINSVVMVTIFIFSAPYAFSRTGSTI